MAFETLHSPMAFLKQMLGSVPFEKELQAYMDWWEQEGKLISAATDRSGTPWLRMFDRFGARVDEVIFPPDYWRMLRKGYEAGVLWRAFEEHSLKSHYSLGFLTSFYDPGIYCPYIVSLATAVSLEKYGAEEVKDRFLPPLLRRDGTGWQGATWMTEAKGGSDLGATVETTARLVGQTSSSAPRSPDPGKTAKDQPRPYGERWFLTGEKYFSSNVGAELAVVAARPEGAPPGVRGLALYLVPRLREEGGLNYFVRRIKDKIATRSVPTGEVEFKDSEAFLLGKPEWGIYEILEVLNLSRVANSIGSVALAQRAMAEALGFSEQRIAFGKPILQHPLLHKQFEDRLYELKKAFALAWEAVVLLDEVWREKVPYSDPYHLFRLIAHLAKYWTAEQAAQTAKWAMEVHGGMGTLAEFPVERWLREAMILAIWEGTPQRQILDGLEVMERKGAHRLLFKHILRFADPGKLDGLQSRVSSHLALPPAEKEAGAEGLFRDLAEFTAEALLRKLEKKASG
ncbi:MAG: acyl-CoA dehydrogenase family protein [Acidobacteriia bacterium]|nr:acyl-CoA dehydrogenase family protein [Terriglobia bacterium]